MNNKTVKELRAEAKSKGLTQYSRVRKADLLIKLGYLSKLNSKKSFISNKRSPKKMTSITQDMDNYITQHGQAPAIAVEYQKFMSEHNPTR
jgi:hypothetical protein